MSESKVKVERVSGFRIAVMVISILLLSLIMAFSMILGVKMLKHVRPKYLGEDATTVRKALPAEGVLPTEVEPLDNIGYMAYVMDHQKLYHTYAKNETNSGGYIQTTQSWKDYKSAEVSGEGHSVMIASDLSHSALVKSATQSCFIGNNKALIRSGKKPSSKGDTPFDISWSTDTPSIYDAKGYKKVYGEFSTEISVYVINEETLEGADEVVDLGDGIYKQTYYLNEYAGVWYQYGMKTRGDLKNYPEFERIAITFTFDSEWRILESYCEENAVISPQALLGMDMRSKSKTTTVYDYTEEGFEGKEPYYTNHGDNSDFDGEKHYAYYNDFFKQYKNESAGNNDDTSDGNPDIITVLVKGFKGVLSGGEQFNLGVSLGNTAYEGKIYLSLDKSDILGSLDARVALGRKGTDSQDLYVEFKNKTINAYYSTDFAMTANIDEVSDAIGELTALIKQKISDFKTPVKHSLTDEGDGGGSGIDLEAIVGALDLKFTENEVIISINSDDLILGIGVDAVLNFGKTVNESGDELYVLKDIKLNSLKYNKTELSLGALITPDGSDNTITHNESEAPANLADYVNSVYKILNSKAIEVNLSLDDTLIDGLSLDVTAHLEIASNIAAYVEISASYNDLSLTLDATYLYVGKYGKIYLHISEVNGAEIDAKVRCDIDDAASTISQIIALFNKGESGGEENAIRARAAESSADSLASIINKVLNLNFGEIIGNVVGNYRELSLEVNVNAILSALDIDINKIISDNNIDLPFDINVGILTLSITNADEESGVAACISGTVSGLGLGLNIIGSTEDRPEIVEDDYVNANIYIEGVLSLLQKPSYNVSISLEGKDIADSIKDSFKNNLTDKIDLSGLSVNGTATVAVSGKIIRVELPATVSYKNITISDKDYSVSLSFTINYTADLYSGSYSEIYLNVASIVVNGQTVTLGAKVYCDVADVVPRVEELIDIVNTHLNAGKQTRLSRASEAEELGKASKIIAQVVGILSSLDYSSLINATETNLSVAINVDDLLAALGFSFADFSKALEGIKLGVLQLNFAPNEGVLSGSLENLGLSVTVSGNESGLDGFDADGYVNLNTYINSIVTLLGQPAYDIDVTFAGKKISNSLDLSGLKVTGTATVKVKGKVVSVELPATVSYDGYSISFKAFYTADLYEKNYTTVYLNVTSITVNDNTFALDAKVYCDVEQAIPGVRQIIDRFTKKNADNEENVNRNRLSRAGEDVTEVEKTDIISKVIGLLLSLDYGEIVTATNTGLSVTLDIDNILYELGFSLADIDESLKDVTLGALKLDFVPADGVLSGSLENLGLSVTLSGNSAGLADLDTKDYVYLNTYLNGVNDLLGMGSYDLTLSFNGNDKISKDIDLSGLEVELAAQIAFAEGYKGAEIDISRLEVSYEGLTIRLSAHYDITFDGSYGTVYLNIEEIYGVEFGIKVKGNINDVLDTVNTVKDSVKPKKSRANDTKDKIDNIVNSILKFDIQELLKSLTVAGDSAQLNLNLDTFLAGLNLGVSLGTVNLTYIPGKCLLTGSDTDIGLKNITISGNEGGLAQFDSSDYLDVVAVLKFVDDIINEGKAIANAKDIVFSINVNAKINGKAVEIVGHGEVAWADKSEKVAISLSVKVDNTDKFEINFVYDRTIEGSEPFVIITINERGTKISQDDLGKYANIQQLIDALTKGKEEGGNKGEGNGDETNSPEIASYGLMIGDLSLSDILKDEDVRKVLQTILGFLSDFTVKLENVTPGTDEDSEEQLAEIFNLIIGYANKVTVKLGADKCLTLNVDSNDFKLNAKVEAGKGDKVYELYTELSARDDLVDISKFVRELYKDFFGFVDDEQNSLSDILNSKTYLVTLDLYGGESGIDVLEGITINAKLHYGEGINDNAIGTKLLHVELDLDIHGTVVSATASYSGNMLYIALNKIGSTTFENVKIKANVFNLFDAVEQLVRIITDTNLINMLGVGTNNLSLGSSEAISTFAQMRSSEGEASTSILSRIISAIFGLDVELSFNYDKENHTVELNVDDLSRALFGIEIGNVTASLNGNKLDLDVKLAGKEETDNPWLSLHAAPCGSVSELINPEDYMDISFLSTLISDLANTVTGADNAIYKLYTFAGKGQSFNVHVANIDLGKVDISSLGVLASAVKALGKYISVDITIEDLTLTVGLDANNNFYISLAGSLQASSLKAIGISVATVTVARKISITYSNGYIVLGRDIDKADAIYKVVTLDYLLENLANSSGDDDSPVRWLLGTTPWLWDAIFGSLNLNVGAQKTYALYDGLEQAAAGGSSFDFKNYIKGLAASFAGEGDPYIYGNAQAAVDKLGLAENYYALSLNAEGLTGGLLNNLYAAILRDGSKDKGVISGLKVYGELATDVASISLSISLNQYLEGETGLLYVDEGKNTLGKFAIANYLNIMESESYGFDRNYDEFDEVEGDYKTPELGCYSTENKSYRPYYRYDTVTLHIYDLDGKSERTLDVPYGSKVLLERVGFPDYTKDSNGDLRKIIYLNAQNQYLGEYTVIAIRDNSRDDINDANVVNTVEIGKDEKGNYFAYLYKSLATADLVTVEFHFIDELTGDEILNPQTFAYALNEKLSEYPQGSYTFLGWYTDESFTNQVTEVSGEMTVYGRYVKTVYDAENGVRYIFDANLYDPDGNTNVKGGYYVGGTNGKISQYYNKSDLWLEIEGEINGYRVYYIAVGAFAKSDDDVDSLVNVLIPESIIAIYENAFAYNKNLKNVFVFADKIFFGGGASNDMGSTSVFYGCYPDNAKNNSDLFVYYNVIRKADPYNSDTAYDKEWHRIYFSNNTKYYLMARTTDYASTLNDKNQAISNILRVDWLYVNYSVVFDGIDLNERDYLNNLKLPFTSGLNTSVYASQEIIDIVLAEINAYTKENCKFINGYNVAVTVKGSRNGEIVLGKYYKVTITITESSDIMYAVTSFAEPNDGAAHISGLEESKYARPGEKYYIVINDGYEFVSATGVTVQEEDGRYYFIMPAEAVEINIVCNKLEITKITLVSDVDFTYTGAEYVTSDDGKYRAQIGVPEGALGDADSKDSQYTFIGWAYSSGESSYTFEGSDVEYSTYYAIWAFKRDEITSLSASGLTLTAQVDVSKADSVYGWYNNSEFNGDAVAVSNSAAFAGKSVTSTKLYARMNFSLTVNFDGKNTEWYYRSADSADIGDISIDKNNGNVTNGEFYQANGDSKVIVSFSVSVVEGYQAEVHRYWGDAIVIKISDGNECVKSYMLKGRTSSTSILGKTTYSWRSLLQDKDHTFAADENIWSVDGSLKNNGYFMKSSNSQALGTVESAKCNISCTIII